MNILNESHLDHGFSPAQIAYIVARFGLREEPFTETFELPEELGTVACALRGPAVGDPPIGDLSHAVYYQRRGRREYNSRIVDMPVQSTRLVTVIAGPHEDQPCVLYTAFGGPIAPKEPGDPTLDDAGRSASEAFWSQHALALSEAAWR